MSMSHTQVSQAGSHRGRERAAGHVSAGFALLSTHTWLIPCA